MGGSKPEASSICRVAIPYDTTYRYAVTAAQGSRTNAVCQPSVQYNYRAGHCLQTLSSLVSHSSSKQWMHGMHQY